MFLARTWCCLVWGSCPRPRHCRMQTPQRNGSAPVTAGKQTGVDRNHAACGAAHSAVLRADAHRHNPLKWGEMRKTPPLRNNFKTENGTELKTQELWSAARTRNLCLDETSSSYFQVKPDAQVQGDALTETKSVTDRPGWRARCPRPQAASLQRLCAFRCATVPQEALLWERELVTSVRTTITAPPHRQGPGLHRGPRGGRARATYSVVKEHEGQQYVVDPGADLCRGQRGQRHCQRLHALSDEVNAIGLHSTRQKPQQARVTKGLQVL